MDIGKNNYGFIRVAAVSPEIKIGNPKHNAENIIQWLPTLRDNAIAVFPEMCLTGYTVGDLFFSETLQKAALDALRRLRRASGHFDTVLVVGLPLAVGGKLFNVAAVVHHGMILGFVPKTYLPTYKEFYEKRWFYSARELTESFVEFDGLRIPIGADLLFPMKGTPGAVLGVEICEDLWAAIPPSSLQALHGATIIANISASNDLIGKSDYRRKLVEQQSARGMCGYIYSSCGSGESSTDVVFGGHLMIAENGTILEERRGNYFGPLHAAIEIDIWHLLHDRGQTSDFGEGVRTVKLEKPFRRQEIKNTDKIITSLSRIIDPMPFVPYGGDERNIRTAEIFSIQVRGLVQRMRATGIKDLVLGLSGGLDSTLAFLLAAEAANILEGRVFIFSLPAAATSPRTKNNAKRLADELQDLKGTPVLFKEIDIRAGVRQQLQDLERSESAEDTVFENTQARYRTMLLLNHANSVHGLVVGTGDLSELALGWCTFNGDHISHYNVNCSIPKTLVKHIVEWYAKKCAPDKLGRVLEDVLNTEYSPELTGDGAALTQKTEELIGPYKLHDFFLYHFIRWGSGPEKIFFLAKEAFKEKYSGQEIRKWLGVFFKRFFENQWKRSVMPDGPKVGSVSLSPRGDWRMPSDMDGALWLAAVDNIQVEEQNKK
ncbi:MAG: NAD(+) synthase [Candidatus Sungbacteria bacterium]|nr:NAD(+) synthase [Candidatus Sungbacteria bacterium]